MLSDIYQKPFKAVVDGKEYFFEFDHSSLAALEKRVGKSIYDIYEALISKKALLLNEVVSMAICSMLKKHSVSEISEMDEMLKNYPGVWHEIKDSVITSFLVALLPPKVLDKINFESKKKEQAKSSKKKKEIN